jgi:uncharacterized protein (TIGR00369 family)
MAMSERVTGMLENERHFRRLERMYAGAPLNEYFKPEMIVGEGRATVKMTLRPDLFHAANAVHGSVLFKALDDAAFFAANSLVEDSFLFTASFNLYFLRPVFEGGIRAEGRVVYRSRRLVLAESEIFDDQDRVIARGSGSFLPSNLALDEKVGYGRDD